MGEPQHCNMTLITQQGCPACKHLIEKVLPFEDVGVDHIHIKTADDSKTVSELYPEANYVPTLVMDCNGKRDYFVGVEKIASMLIPEDKDDGDDFDGDVEL